MCLAGILAPACGSCARPDIACSRQVAGGKIISGIAWGVHVCGAKWDDVNPDLVWSSNMTLVEVRIKGQLGERIKVLVIVMHCSGEVKCAKGSLNNGTHLSVCSSTACWVRLVAKRSRKHKLAEGGPFAQVDPHEALVAALKREIHLLRTENAYFRSQVPPSSPAASLMRFLSP